MTMATNTSSSKITTELLEALLSPDAQRRGQAEAFFQGISLLERVSGLVPMMMIMMHHHHHHHQQQQIAVVSLAAVLLRRDILRLTDLSALESMVDPLLESFLSSAAGKASPSSSSTSQTTRTAIGYCLAEICGTVALVSPSSHDKKQVMARILNAIANAVAQGDIPSLRLVAGLAERAPTVFASTAVPSLQNLIRQVVSSCLVNSSNNNNNNNNNNDNDKATILEALMQVLVQAAIAAQPSTTTTTSQLELMTSMLPFASKPVDTVDPASAAAELGRTCMPLLLEPMANLYNNNNSSMMMLAILQQWTMPATHCPSLLAGDKAVFQAVVDVCLTVANAFVDKDSTTALAALEVLSSLCAVGDVKRKILAVDPSLCQRLLEGNSNLQQQQQQQQQQGVLILAAHFMETGVDDDVEGWASEPAYLLDDDQFDGDDVAWYAESLFQSFLHSLSAPALAVTLPLVENLLQPQTPPPPPNQQWRRLRAGLSMMEACLASAPVSFAPHLTVAMEAAMALANDGQEHAIRVQWQALHLLGVLCETDTLLVAGGGNDAKSETLRERYGLRILQTLSRVVQSPCTKVSAIACRAIVSFCRGGSTVKMTTNDDDSSRHAIVQYLPEILQSLISGPLSTDSFRDRVVQIRAIAAVACLAEAVGEAFCPYYPSIMPTILSCSQTQHRGCHEINQLVGASIEAATIIGQAIESDETTRARYVLDAEKIMQFIVTVLQQLDKGATSDLPLDQLLSACARIASVMGADYSPYVNVVLPHLLQRAAAPPDVSVSEGDEAGLETTKRNGLEIDDDLGTESLTVAVPGKGMQKFTVNTTKIQEKAQACRALHEHAAALGSHFGPYVETCLNALVPLVTFQFSSEVRSTSAAAVASVFEAACCSADESFIEASHLQQYYPLLVKTVVKQIQAEGVVEMEALFALADSLSEILYSSHQRKETYGQSLIQSLSFAGATETVGSIMQAISACLKRRSDIYKVLSGGVTGDDEKEECQAQLREEEQLLTPLVDSVGYILKGFKSQFVPLFDKLVAPALGPSLTNGDIRARLSAVCLYDDCVEHCGSEAAAKHAENLVYGVLLGINDQSNGNDVDLKSASIYGISQICRYAPSSVLAPHLETIFHHLLLVVRSSTKDESESPMMYENAISALASLMLIGPAPFANAGFVKKEEVLAILVDNLPLREDGDEAKICHAGFCDLLESGSINAAAQTEKILQVLGEIIAFVAEGENIATPDTCSRLANILVQMQQTLPADRMNEAFASISVEAQNGVNLAMQ